MRTGENEIEYEGLTWEKFLSPLKSSPSRALTPNVFRLSRVLCRPGNSKEFLASTRTLDYGALSENKAWLCSVLDRTDSAITYIEARFQKALCNPSDPHCDRLAPPPLEANGFFVSQVPADIHLVLERVLSFEGTEILSKSSPIDMPSCGSENMLFELPCYSTVWSETQICVGKIRALLQHLKFFVKLMIIRIEHLRMCLGLVIQLSRIPTFLQAKILIEDPWHFFHGTHPPEQASAQFWGFVFQIPGGRCVSG
jgi:hypothetical protein